MSPGSAEESGEIPAGGTGRMGGGLRAGIGDRIGAAIRARPGFVLAVVGLAAGSLLSGCGPQEPEGEAPGPDSEAWEGDVEAVARLARPREGTEEDWMVHYLTVTEAWDRGWDTLAMGESMARLGATFVGTRYVPKTLELAGDEAVVVNLQELDCVTFVENVLALARFIRLAEPGILDSDVRTRELYRDLLREIRYRGGRVEGYPSRLHYFSDWIRDNEAKGLVREVTGQLGGVEDLRAIDFMSTHPEAYRQLANPVSLAAIEEVEEELSGLTRHRIPQDDIPAWASWIRDGDIIAATSTVEGLDVAHTGLAYWQDGELHLLHAPLVGEAVEISELPLATRILRIQGQDGIRVLRPLPPEETADGPGGGPADGPGEGSADGAGEGPASRGSEARPRTPPG